jgi:hypothetical protein
VYPGTHWWTERHKSRGWRCLLAERCQSLRSNCEFCGQDVYWPCDDAEKAERCGRRLSARKEALD